MFLVNRSIIAHNFCLLQYWMHKFRDTTPGANEVQNRSVLQSQFTSSCLVAQNVPLIICLVLSSLFGYRIKAKDRIVAALLVLIAAFIMFTIFVTVNTDDCEYFYTANSQKVRSNWIFLIIFTNYQKMFSGSYSNKSNHMLEFYDVNF